MNLTENDKLFLQTVQRASQSHQAVVTTSLLLSEELLNIFEVPKNAKGFWCFNVYVELEPAFKTQEPKEWQKVRQA